MTIFAPNIIGYMIVNLYFSLLFLLIFGSYTHDKQNSTCLSEQVVNQTLILSDFE